MKCSIQTCAGEYEHREVFHAVRRRGQIMVIDHVPAEVCTICGDVIFRPDTVRGIEDLLRTLREPETMVPLYEYVTTQPG